MTRYYANDCECENLQEEIAYCDDNLYDEEKFFIVEIELLQWLDEVYTSYPEYFQIKEIEEYSVE